MVSKPILLITISFLISVIAYPQQKGFRLPDSLAHKSFRYLYDQSAIHENDTAKAVFYIDAWISKAKKEQDFGELVDAYDEKIYFSKIDLRLKYADSAVIAARKTKHNGIIGSAILTKGNEYLFRKNNAAALDFFLQADAYISKTNDDDLKNTVKFSIANIKIYLGFYSEALQLYQECVVFYKKQNSWNANRSYLNALFGIGTCFTKLGQYEKATEINTFALKEARRLKVPKSEKYIIGSEGINQYFRKNSAQDMKIGL